MFHSARIKLTLWYLAISMTVSLLFSAAIYSGVNAEFRRFERMHDLLRERIESGLPVQIPRSVPRSMLDPDMINQARSRLLTSLGIINLSIVAAAGAAGYFLAGRTLRPIRDMVEEQQRFISDASHELRTPLTSLRSEIEVNLRNPKLSIKEARALLTSNLEETIRLQTLSDRLLALTKYDTQNQRQLQEKFSLEEAVGEAVQKVRPIAHQKNITVSASVTDSSIHGNRENLVELFVILLDNAIKYSPAKEKVVLSSVPTKGYYTRVDITDHGIGIEEKDIPHVFERFYRADSARSHAGLQGYGLGLSIAQKIVQSLKGSISVKSTFGKGTTFSVTLPTIATNKRNIVQTKRV